MIGVKNKWLSRTQYFIDVRLLEKLFINHTNSTFIQLFRYTFVGGGAFAVDFFLLWFLTDICGLDYLLSATFSFLTGLAVNYLIATRWVFEKNTAILRNKWMEFLIFLLIGLIGLALNNLILWFVTEKLCLYYLFSKVVAAGIVYLWNFFARKYILFNHKTLAHDNP